MLLPARRRDQRGMALVYVSIMLILILGLLAIFLINMANQVGTGSVDYLKGKEAYQLALSGVDYMFDLARTGQLTGTYGPFALGGSTDSFKVEVEDLGNNLLKITITGEASGYERVFSYAAASRPRPFFPEDPLVDDAPDGTIPGETQDTTMEDIGHVEDALIWEKQKTTNYGSYSYLYTGKVSKKKTYSLVKLDLTFIPLGRSIVSATVQMRLDGGSDSHSRHIGVYRITRDWVEDEVTWRQAESGQNWSSQGGDYDHSAEDVQSVRWHGSNDYVSWDVTNSVTDIYNSVYPNYGWLFKYTRGDKKYTIFDSKEYYECWPSWWWCWYQFYYPPRITVEYSGPPTPDGLQIYSPVTMHGDLFVRGNVLVADGATMGDPPGDPVTLYVPVGDTVVSNEFDSYFSWAHPDSIPQLAFAVPAVADTIDSLIEVARNITHTGGNKFQGNRNWTNTTLDLSTYDQNRIFVNGDVKLKGVTIPSEGLESPGLIIADGDIKLQKRDHHETSVGDNIILIANGKIEFKDATYFGEDHSAQNPADRPETVNMAWARDYSYYADGDIEIKDDATVWANCVAYGDGELESTLYGGFFSWNELDIADNHTYLEGAIWTSTLKNDAISAGTFNFTNIYPTVFFAGREIQVYAGGYSEE